MLAVDSVIFSDFCRLSCFFVLLSLSIGALILIGIGKLTQSHFQTTRVNMSNCLKIGFFVLFFPHLFSFFLFSFLDLSFLAPLTVGGVGDGIRWSSSATSHNHTGMLCVSSTVDIDSPRQCRASVFTKRPMKTTRATLATRMRVTGNSGVPSPLFSSVCMYVCFSV